MNGNITPVFGMELVTTAIFKITWIAICDITPTTKREPNRSGALFAITIIRHKISINNTITQTAPNKPSSSQRKPLSDQEYNYINVVSCIEII